MTSRLSVARRSSRVWISSTRWRCESADAAIVPKERSWPAPWQRAASPRPESPFVPVVVGRRWADQSSSRRSATDARAVANARLETTREEGTLPAGFSEWTAPSPASAKVDAIATKTATTMAVAVGSGDLKGRVERIRMTVKIGLRRSDSLQEHRLTASQGVSAAGPDKANRRPDLA